MNEQYFKVKNWEKYQDHNLARKYLASDGHVKALPWVKQLTRRLDDHEYQRLHPLSRYVWGELIGLAAIEGPNRLLYDLPWLETRLHLHFVREQFAACMDELFKTGFLEFISPAVADSGPRSAKVPPAIPPLRRKKEDLNQEVRTKEDRAEDELDEVELKLLHALRHRDASTAKWILACRRQGLSDANFVEVMDALEKARREQQGLRNDVAYAAGVVKRLFSDRMSA